jgi:hypothetical protein
MYDGVTLSEDLFGPNGWFAAQTHEGAETVVDPATNTLRADGKGKLFAQEASDPLEVQTYPITIKADGTVADVPSTTPGLASDGSFTAYCANFVLDAYFTPNHAGPYDFLTAQGKSQGGPAAPFEIVPSGGGDYQIVETDPGDETQVTGMAAAHEAEGKPFAIMGKGAHGGHLVVMGRLTRRVEKKAHPSSRPYRRGLRFAASGS